MLHMSESTVVLKLKELILDHMGEKIHEAARLDASAEQLKGKTISEVRKMAPILDVGTLILRLLATSVKPKDAEEAGKIYTYIKSIRNKYSSAKGEWLLEEKDLKELKEYMKKTEGELRSPMMIGQLFEMLSDLELELKEKSKKPDTKDKE